MRNSASRAILDSALYVNEVTSAFISERKKRATAKHTVEKLSLYLMAGEILAAFVLEKVIICHFISPSKGKHPGDRRKIPTFPRSSGG